MLRNIRVGKIRTGLLACFLISISGMTISLPEARAEMAFLKVPTSCLRLEKVEGNKVHLKSGPEGCTGASSKLPVIIDPAMKRVAVYIDSVYREEQDVEGFDMKNIGGRGQEEAGKTLTYYQSEAFRGKVDAEVERLKTTVFKETLTAYYGDGKAGEKSAVKGVLPDNERIYLFISSSMPLETLKNYARDIERLGDPHVVMVMRGFVGGMKYIKPTLAFVQRAVTKDPQCDPDKAKCESYRVSMNIDPLLFRRYGINRVPAAVYVPDVRVQDTSLSEAMEGNVKAAEHYSLSGDASLGYILDAFHRESGKDSLLPLMESLKGGIYGKERKR